MIVFIIFHEIFVCFLIECVLHSLLTECFFEIKRLVMQFSFGCAADNGDSIRIDVNDKSKTPLDVLP